MHPDFELRKVSERVAVDFPACDGIAACQLLDQRLIQPVAVLRLGRRHKPCARECGEIVAVLGLILGVDESFEGCVLSVPADHMPEHLKEHALAVGSRATQEEHRLNARVAAQSVPRCPCKEVNHLLVAGHDLPEEAVPHRALRLRVVGDWRNGRQHVRLGMRAELSGL